MTEHDVETYLNAARVAAAQGDPQAAADYQEMAARAIRKLQGGEAR